MNIESELSQNRAVLLLLPSLEYNDIIVDVAKKLSKESLCYVTLNKTHSSLREMFQKKKVNVKNIVFVDAISKSIKPTPDQTDGCYFVSSPNAFTEISMVVSKISKHNFKYLIFDSISNLLPYENKPTIIKFLSSTISRLIESNTRCVFYALREQEQEQIIKECSMFVNKVIEVK